MTQVNSDSYRNPLRYQGQDYTYVPLYYRQRDPTTTDIRPKEQTGYYLIGSEWMNTVTGDYWYLSSFSTVANVLQANWVLFGGATGDLLTLSDSLGTVVPPTAAGNIQLIGQVNEQVGAGQTPFTTTLANFAGNFISFNPMSSSRWIVDPLSAFPNPNGTHTTIASALSDAVSGDTIFVLPGTYIENLTLKAGVCLAAYECDAYNGTTIVQGTVTASYSGTVSITGIQFITNGATAFDVTADSVLNLINCKINANDAVGFTINHASAQVNLDNCIGGNLLNNAFFVVTLGTLEISDSFIGNSSNSATAICTCAGTFNCFTTHFDYPVTTSGSGSLNYYFSLLHTAGSGTTAVTLVGTGGATLEDCVFQTGGAVAITVGAGCNCNLQNNVIDSTATPDAVTGAGSINYANNSFVNTSLISTTTQSANTLRYAIARSTLQPAFMAYAAANKANVTGDGTIYTVVFETEQFDQLSNYDPATGIFTAPASGRYHFDVAVAMDNSLGGTVSSLAIVSTGLTVTPNSLPVAALGGNGWYYLTSSITLNMAATDTVRVNVAVFGGTLSSSVQGSATPSTYFSGYLVC